MNEHTTTARAADHRAGMTLAELSQFVQAALDAGTDPRDTLKARVGFKGQLAAVTTGKRLP